MPTHTTPVRQRTRLLFRIHGISLLMATVASLVACQPSTSTPIADKTMNSNKRQIVYFDVSAISYQQRPIFEIRLNGKEVGAGGGSLMAGVALELGPQTVTWRNAETGATTRAANQPLLDRPDAKLTYLGLHIYPDNTVELVPSPFWPERTEKGEAMLQKQEKQSGQ
jgi:hypothetical protein